MLVALVISIIVNIILGVMLYITDSRRRKAEWNASWFLRSRH